MKWVIILAILGQGASAGDSAQTIHFRNYDHSHNLGWVENDPLERPIAHLPAPVYFGITSAETASCTWLGVKMRHSDHATVRKLWWVPQVAQIAGNAFGVGFSLSHQRVNRSPETQTRY